MQIVRDDIQMQDWGLDSLDSLKKYWRMYRLCRNQLKKTESLRIHCTHAVPEGLVASALKTFSRKKVQIICYAHGEEISACQSSRQLNAMYSWASKRCDLIVANSQNTKNLLSPYASNSKVRVISPGVSLRSMEQVKELQSHFRNKNVQHKDQFILLTVGRLDRRKNHRGVLQALPQLLQRIPNIHYIIVGDGDERSHLESMVLELNLSEVVTFYGEVEDATKCEFLAACDVFVSPGVSSGTSFEGYGIVFLEAASFAKPSIAGTVGGQPESVINGETGIIVDGTSIEEIASAILALHSDKNLRESLGARGYKLAAENSWDIVSAKIYQACEELSLS
jgi:phosphatidylinositol alpha-1,6-mannosyltransferase